MQEEPGEDVMTWKQSNAALQLLDPEPPEGTEGAWLARESSGAGIWELHPGSGEHILSARGREMLGIDGDGPISVHRFLAALHPDDRARWREAVAEVLNLEGSGECHVEFRTAGPVERWLAASGRAFLRGDSAEHVVGTFQDVTERKAVEAVRDRRLRDLRHELRIPLDTLAAGIDLVQRGEVSPKVASTLRSTVERMDRLVERLVLSAGNGSEELELDRERGSLAEICREAAEEASLAHPGRSIEVEAWDEGLGEWDTDRLLQAVRNLISNALRHGAPDKPIVVSVVEYRGEAVLVVANFGPPIPVRFAEQLFGGTPGERWPNDRRGLAIVKEIVAAHAGRIELSSDDDGTVFHLWLPKVPGDELAARA
jgi:signal transduction histidine kinase